jgi:N-acetylneuraminic acid mutarotase
MGAQAVALNGYMYYISGCSVSSCTSYNAVVQYAPINNDGTLGTFSTTTSLPAGTGNNAGRIGFTAFGYNNKLYIVGGVEKTTGGADTYMSTVRSATQNSGGTLSGTWATETSIPAARAFHTTVVWHNIVYVMGGRDASTVYGTIYYAPITGNAIGAWSTATQSITARWAHSAAIWGNWIYVMSGLTSTSGTFIGTTAGTNAVQQLTVGTTAGNITAAPTGYASGTAVRFAGGFAHNGYIYAMGGSLSSSTNATNNMYWAALDPTTGAPGAFSNTNIGNFTTPYGFALARSMPAVTTAEGYVYAFGGCTSSMTAGSFTACTTFPTTTNATEVYQHNNGGTGQTSAFSSMQAIPTAQAEHASLAYNGKLYVIGGCTAYTSGVCSAYSTEVKSNAINPDGTLNASWTTLNALPSGRSAEQAVAYNGYMYVIGGRSAGSAATGTVWYAPINSDGTLGSWVDSSSNYLPSGAERRSFGAAISNGYIYVGGGQDASNAYLSNVYYAQLSSTGSVGSWATTVAFTTARASLGMTAYNGVLYVVGGTNGTAQNDIQYAKLNTDGTVPSWSYTTDIDRGLSYGQVAAANGYMYFIGTDGASTEVKYADINANGTLGTLHYSSNVMAGGHIRGAAAYSDGSFYVTGGCVLSGTSCTTVSNTSEGAGQQAISRVGHYSKLFDTQVDTSPTQVVLNGTNSGAGSSVEFQLQTASSLDTTLGIAQSIRPVTFGNFYLIQALDSSGNNVGVAFRYFILLALDDSKSGTFPDVNQSGSQTATSSLTLYYHANSARRLRHGASFTDTGCNPTPAQGCLLDTAP